jgi:hypothetical protein
MQVVVVRVIDPLKPPARVPGAHQHPLLSADNANSLRSFAFFPSHGTRLSHSWSQGFCHRVGLTLEKYHILQTFPPFQNAAFSDGGYRVPLVTGGVGHHKGSSIMMTCL